MADSTQRRHLLALPQELRNEIYSYVFFSHQDPPPNPSFPGGRIKVGSIDYSNDRSAWQAPGLIQVNRQVREEYSDFAEKLLASRQVTAELDIMAKGYVFVPSWIFFPSYTAPQAKARTINLHVNLRIFSTESFRSNDGWPRQPGTGFRSLLRLLNEFVHRGPSFGQHEHHTEELAREFTGPLFTISQLSVYVTFHDDYTPATHPETAQSIHRMLSKLALDGLASGIIKKGIYSRSETFKGKQKVPWSQYDIIEDVYDADKAEQWREIGFMRPGQRNLGEDFLDK